MADVKKVIEIDIDVNSEGLDDVNKKLEQTSQSVEKVGDSQANTNELVMKGGEVLDQYTGGLFGLARKWFEMGKAAKTSLTGIKTGLVSTGIGALVVALGLIVAYWDDITAALGFANDEQEDLNNQTDDYNVKIRTAYENLVALKNTNLERIKAEALADGESIDNLEAQIRYQRELYEEKKKEVEALKDQEKIEKIVIQNAQGYLETKEIAYKLNKQELEQLATLEEESKSLYLTLEGLIKQQGDATLEEIEKENAARDADADKRKALLQKYYDLAESLNQAHQLALIENDRERQLKALEFELENNKRSIANSEFTEEQKEIIKAQYLQAFQDKKEALEAQWAKEELDAKKAREDAWTEYYRNQDSLRLEIMAEGIDKELAMIDAKYDALFEKAAGNAELEKELTEAQERDIQAIQDKYAEEQRKKEEDRAKQELEDARWLMNAKLDMTTQSLQLADEITNLFVAKNEKQARTQFNISKGLRLAEATISAIQGAQNAFTAAQANIPATVGSFGAYPYIQAGLAAGFGAVKVAMIAKQKFQPSGGGGGGGGVGDAGGGAAPMPAPQFNIVGAGATNQLSQSIADQTAKPVKAYVVANDVTTMQALDRNRRSQSAFP